MMKSMKKMNGKSDEQMIINNLVEAFSLASIEEARIAYKQANYDLNKAIDILTENYEAYNASCSSSGGGGSTSSSCSSSSSSGGSDGNGVDYRELKWSKGKKIVATAGMVSNLIGKDYVSGKSKKTGFKEKGLCGGGKVNVEEMEQFLCEMLGDDCQLSMAVVKDVLCSCGYDVEKALEVLLELSASPSEPSTSDKYSNFSSNSDEFTRNMEFSDSFWQLTDEGSDSNSYHSESDVPDSMQYYDYTGRNYAEALLSSESSRKLVAACPRTEDELPQQLLESLFTLPKSEEHEPSSMNWNNVVKQMESFAQKRTKLDPSDSLPQPMITQAISKGTEYQVFRETAQQRWDKTKFCYHKAASAFSNGEKYYASYMSEQGKLYKKMAQQADEKASMEIFKARNKGIENSLTIDLHGQHVKQALKMVKLHLLFATSISSVQHIRVITGCGSQGLGTPVVKQSVINLLKKERVTWREENQGTVLIKLDGPREFRFLDSERDSWS